MKILSLFLRSTTLPEPPPAQPAAIQVPVVDQKAKFEEFYRILRIVAKARYRAQNRLALHAAFAQFALTALSVGLIIIPLLVLGGIPIAFDRSYVDVLQIIFAVALLGYSLLLAMARHEARAEKMHACGLIVSRIQRQIEPYRKGEPPPSADTFEVLQTRYYDALEKFENHAELDYYSVMMDIMVAEGFPRRTPQQTKWDFALALYRYHWKLLKRRTFVYFSRVIIFGHYFATVAALYFCIYALLRGWPW